MHHLITMLLFVLTVIALSSAWQTNLPGARIFIKSIGVLVLTLVCIVIAGFIVYR